MKWLLTILAILAIIWWQPLDFGQCTVTIPKGLNSQEIAKLLAKEKIVRNIGEFLLLLKLSKREKDLKAGIYDLPRFKNPIYLINRLIAGGRPHVVVTIPEGCTIYETARILGRYGLVVEEEFIRLAKDRDFIKSLGLDTPSLEGYLFPDTYFFNHSQSEAEIIERFIKNFKNYTAKFNLDPSRINQILILASMVEKEAKYKDERPIIAKVFINRLNSKRPLESCASVIYALKNNSLHLYRPKERLTGEDLKIDSPYNTYLNPGLPPGPICSPGRDSIKAVISPANVDYFYFVSKGNGRHHFSKTYKEHLMAKRIYQDQM